MSKKSKKYNINEKEFKYEVIKPHYNNYYIDTNNELKIEKLKELSIKPFLSIACPGHALMHSPQ